MKRALVMAICSMVGLAVPAVAQTTPTGLFVQGGGLAAFEAVSVFENLGGAGTTGEWHVLPGVEFAAGTFLAPRVSLRLEATILGLSENEESEIGDPILTGVPTTIFSESSESRWSAFSVLVGYHPEAMGRWRVGYLAGIAFNRIHSESTRTITSSSPVFPVFPEIPVISVIPVVPRTITYESESVFYESSAIVGADVAATIREHLSLVAEIRALSFGGALHLRPGLSLRWSR